MATQTTHYNLIKPSSADRVAVGDLNDNADTIDGYLYQANERADQIADDYNTSSTYNTGDYVRRENYIYKCNSNSVTGNWDSTKWDRVKVMESVETAEDGVDNAFKIMGVMGAKNLIPYPYYDGYSTTHNGITYTVNSSDGSITANGTATAVSNFLLDDYFTLKAGSYIISGGKSVNQTVDMYHNVSPYTTVWQSSGSDFAFTTTQDNYPCRLRIRIASGQTLNNVTFYPMVRPGGYQDSTYAPYAQTNRELTENKVDWVSNGVLGAKNLLPFPYFSTRTTSTFTNNGVTYTVDSDGVITANGTAETSDSAIVLTHRMQRHQFLKAGETYILSGLPSNGSNSTFQLRLYLKAEDDSNIQYVNTGDSSEVTFTVTDTAYYGIYAHLRVIRGYTATNLVVEPMIRLASVKDDTYTPYAMTNKNLTDIVKCNQSTAGTYTLQATVASNGAVTYEWVSTT